ncbi:MAG: peptide chain release factor N(5)-glutamine methyltransferase [Rhizomicrobium sp.]
MSDPLAAAVARLREAGVDNPRLDARLLWEFARSLSSPAVAGEGDREAVEGAAAGRLFDTLSARRAAREPLAYITGTKEFWSVAFAVGPGVLIPRPDTETLIEELIRLYPDRSAPLSILDLGTGSGCLLVAALTEYPAAHGVGIDASPEALAWARRNVAAHGLEARASLIETAWPEEASPGFDVLLSNPPYIPTAEIDTLEPEVSRHEPRPALDGGPDGLDAYRALAPRIARLLKPSGSAILEFGAGQADAVTAIMASEGLRTMKIAPDLAGIPRCTVVKSAARSI